MNLPTRALQEQIAAAIRAGAFPHVAAQSFGISAELFDHWRELGESEKHDENLRPFARAIDEAIAQARLRAEIEVFNDQPRIWLQHGPGRETAGCPGWTVAAKPIATAAVERDHFMSPETMALLHALGEVFHDDALRHEHIESLFAKFFVSP